jgi:hypothetical protein
VGAARRGAPPPPAVRLPLFHQSRLAAVVMRLAAFALLSGEHSENCVHDVFVRMLEIENGKDLFRQSVRFLVNGPSRKGR